MVMMTVPMSPAVAVDVPVPPVPALPHFDKMGRIRFEHGKLRSRSMRHGPWAGGDQKGSPRCEGKQSHFHFRNS